MEINTDRLLNLAQEFTLRLRSLTTAASPMMQDRHGQIQQSLANLSAFFKESAGVYEQAEQSLRSVYTRRGSWKTSHYANWNVISQLTRQDRTSYFSGRAEYAFLEFRAGTYGTYSSAGLQAALGDISVKGSCEIGLWENKEFDPRVELNAEAQASLVSVQANARIGTSQVYATGMAKGSAGAVYAKAECVLSKEEQTLEAGVGAAALRGEASLSFVVFGATVTLTAQGSLGSAEANISYSHKNKEWEFGSKLGFIAGLGFKVRVSY